MSAPTFGPARGQVRIPRLDVVRPVWLRIVVAGLGVTLFIVGLAVSPTAWPAWLALAAPDLPGLAGAGRNLAPRQMHPRAVRGYNATHRLTGGTLLLVIALCSGRLLLTGIALAWLAHVLIDRAAGYTLRTPDGFGRR